MSIFSAVGIVIAGLSTLLFWIFRKPISAKVEVWKINAKWKFIIIGSLSAVWIEFEFWAIEKIFGVSGIAASPNIFLDLLVTMPWYIIMIWLLYKIEMRYSYSLFAILILGGVYDFFADGVLGTVLSGNFSLVTPALLLIIFPLFFISYSFIVFPATYLLQNDRTIQLNQKTNWKKYPFALLPLLGLLVYGIILVILF